MIYEYFIILTKVYNGSHFDACSDFFDKYPTNNEIKEELERLNNMFDTVYDARVEKRYHLTKRWK